MRRLATVFVRPLSASTVTSDDSNFSKIVIKERPTMSRRTQETRKGFVETSVTDSILVLVLLLRMMVLHNNDHNHNIYSSSRVVKRRWLG